MGETPAPALAFGEPAPEDGGGLPSPFSLGSGPAAVDLCLLVQ